jgi:hypothetical protein
MHFFLFSRFWKTQLCAIFALQNPHLRGWSSLSVSSSRPSLVVESMAALDFVGRLSRAKYIRGNPRSSDQSMVALLASYPPWRHRLGASLLRSISSPSLGNFGGNPRFGSPGSDDGNMCRRSPPWGHRFWSWCWLEGLCGGATCIYLVDDGETRPRGPAGSRRWPWLDGVAQDGGAV